MTKKVIITGSSGMLGKAVLLECLESSKIEQVLVVNRSPLDIKHLKLSEVLLKDFTNFESIKEALKGYDACFHCMGVSSSGICEEKYTKLTFDITQNLVDTLYSINPKMTVNYVSGQGTDTSEKGSSMWARVKGKTENYILNKGFAAAYMFRAGVVIPEKGLRSKTNFYNILYAVVKPFAGLLKKSKHITSTTKLGQAMLASLETKQTKKHLENAAINLLSSKYILTK